MSCNYGDIFSFQDIMNREKEDQLPLMQVGFIDSICLPIYEVNMCANNKVVTQK